MWIATGKMDPSKGGIQFGKVSIVIPKTWKVKTNGFITWQQCGKADILITNKRESGNRNVPFTKQIGKCGQPGESIRILDTFMDSDDRDQILIRGEPYFDRIILMFVRREILMG